ncbi:outer membrane beta-barrel protein [Helicobacter cetorum]|uniref:Outer membrane protein n=1 Tax=Helicobacter cetorum (strain ATCC BAA-540 / CCUG 52418 / MIT 99-5656) TaxID=1163745 RepID=I0ERN4_HELCM|nr:outer membrane beta-barrel protein [Helicobacter cetorum]AFI05603.1 hypothetical protein HCD_02935 [Helicobacter cetorum MIT 99-5656]
MKNFSNQLAHLSKSTALVLVGLLSNLESHPKSGVFIEAGFETGELQARQRQKALNNNGIDNYSHSLLSQGFSPSKTQTNNKPLKKDDSKSGSSKAVVYSHQQDSESQASISLGSSQAQADENPKTEESQKPHLTLKERVNFAQLQQELESNIKTINTANATKTDLFAKENITKLKISTTAPIQVNYDLKNPTNPIKVQNFLPYDLQNVDLYVKYTDENNKQHEVKIATIDNIDKDKEISINASEFPQLGKYFSGELSVQDFEIKPQANDTSNTARVLNAVNSIFTDISGVFSNAQIDNRLCGKNCMTKVTPEDAKNWTNTLLSLAYVFDSETWVDMVKNADFKFWDGSKSHIISQDEIIKRFQSDTSLKLQIIRPETKVRGLENQRSGLLAVESQYINLAKLPALKDYKYCKHTSDLSRGECLKLYTNSISVLHEYAHAKGFAKNFNHDGNMTKHYSDSFPGLTIDAWIQLGADGDLPIYYENGQLKSFTNPSEVKHDAGTRPKNCDWLGINVDNNRSCQPKQQSAQAQVLAHSHYLQTPNTQNTAESSINSSLSSMFKEHLNNAFATLSNQLNNNNSLNNTTSQTLKAPMLGFNAMLGYQQYFNDYIGLSYYGFFNYNNANLKGVLNSVTQSGLGLGTNLLIDFYTSYDNNSVRNVFGIFGGFRGLWNNYKSNGLIRLNKNIGNIHFTTGINYRYKHSKFSIGLGIPLMKQNIKARLLQETTISEVELNETPKNMHIYFNYGWVF